MQNIELNLSTTATLGIEESGRWEMAVVEWFQIWVNVWIFCPLG